MTGMLKTQARKSISQSAASDGGRGDQPTPDGPRADRYKWRVTKRPLKRQKISGLLKKPYL